MTNEIERLRARVAELEEWQREASGVILDLGGWRRHYWSSLASYQTTAAAARAANGEAVGNLSNRHEECLWISPHCLGGERDQRSLFEDGAA